MKIISNNKGISLVETLVMTSILGVAAFGLLKASQQTLITSQIVKIHKDTNDLKNSVYNLLNNHCTYNLQSSNLKIPDSAGLQKMTELRGAHNVLFRMQNISNKPIKDKFKDFIDIVDMKVTKNKKQFYLYYKYNLPAIGDKQKRTDDPCTNSNVKGCYYLSCEMDSECIGTDTTCDETKTVRMCEPMDCISSEATSLEVTCEKGEVLVNLTGRKEDDCLGCPEGEFLIGIKIEDDGTKKPECLKSKACENTSEVAVGTKLKAGEDEKYTMDCVDWTCPEGEHRVLRVEGGQTVMKCEQACHGGQIIVNEGNQKICTCPEFKKTNEHGNCVCVAGRDKDGDGNCVCPADSKDDGNGNCVCKSSDVNERNEDGKCYCYHARCPSEWDCVCKYGITDTNGRCKADPAMHDDFNIELRYDLDAYPPCP